jgi:hypothetical protein
MRVRITIRGDAPARVELRGFIDIEDMQVLGEFSEALKPYGLVIASAAEDDYNPFTDWNH